MSLLFVVFGIICVFGEKRNFSPENAPDSLSDIDLSNPEIGSITYIGEPGEAAKKKKRARVNPDRVLVLLNQESECFQTESDAFAFKDYLLSQYSCISFQKDRKQIYTHAVSADRSGWSLWLENNGVNFDCLDEEIDLPPTISSSCIQNVYYEPVEYTTACVESDATYPFDFWSLDILDSDDGVLDGKFIYTDFEKIANDNVEVIVLDSMVNAHHNEFDGIKTNSLFSGKLGTCGRGTEYWHGTFVAAVVVGNLYAGGARNTKLNFFPVCQSDRGCYWSDIEAGYNTAIQYMNDNNADGKRFVINYSIGGLRDYDYQDAQYVVWGEAITAAGGIWVTSAGNKAADACNFKPAFSPWSITVGAYDRNLQPASFTNYGQCVDTYGPGVDIISAYADSSTGRYTRGYAISDGTSFSSPNIAAIIVNILKEDNTLNLEQIKAYLEDNSRSVYGGVDVGTMKQAYFKCGATVSAGSGSGAMSNNGGDNVPDMFGIKHAKPAETYSILTVIIIAAVAVLIALICGGYQCVQKRKAFKELNAMDDQMNGCDINIDNEKPLQQTEVVNDHIAQTAD